MTIQHIFRNLVEAFHQDTNTQLVDDLAIQFTAESAKRIYELKQPAGIKLLCITIDQLSRLENIHLLLTSYGIGLTTKRLQAGSIMLGVNILPPDYLRDYRTYTRSQERQEQINYSEVAR